MKHKAMTINRDLKVRFLIWARSADLMKIGRNMDSAAELTSVDPPIQSAEKAVGRGFKSHRARSTSKRFVSTRDYSEIMHLTDFRFTQFFHEP